MNVATFLSKNTKNHTSNNSHVPPIILSSSFEFQDVDQSIAVFDEDYPSYVYSRYGNPAIDAVAQKLAKLATFGDEAMDAVALITSSGMSAIHVLLQAVLKPGDAVVIQPDLYGGTLELFHQLLQPLGITTIAHKMEDLNSLEATFKQHKNIRGIYFESPTNPLLRCVDLTAVQALAKQFGITTMVDNTFATSLSQQPLLLGIDFVVHSTTKYLSGHGFMTGGAIIGRDASFMLDQVWKILKLGGATPSPFDAWLLGQGMRTMELRFDKQCRNALELAQFLSEHKDVAQLRYPGLDTHPQHALAKTQMKKFGGIVTVEFKTAELAKRFMNRTKLMRIAPTLGDMDTLLLHPASSSHLRMPEAERNAIGITDGLVRISCGIENLEDLKQDVQDSLG